MTLPPLGPESDRPPLLSGERRTRGGGRNRRTRKTWSSC